MNEQLRTSDGTETLDMHAHGSAASTDAPAGSLWASAIGTTETPRREAEGLGEVTARVPALGQNAVPSEPLLNSAESLRLRTRWSEIQGQFVDEPRSAVQQADSLVSEVIEQITRILAKEHSALETPWKRGDDVSTEDLRKALQHYRSFFNRLVV